MKFYNKGQIQGQIFIYILTLIIAGIIFMFGYNAISSFSNQIENSKLLDFEIEMNKVFDKIGSEYESFERHTFNLPQNYKKVCFINLDHPDYNNPPSSLENYPFINDSIYSLGIKNNVFLYTDGFEKALNVGKIKIKNNTVSDNVFFICYTLLNGQLNLDIRGLGDKAEIEETKPE